MVQPQDPSSARAAELVGEAREAYGAAAAELRHEHLLLEAHAPWLVQLARVVACFLHAQASAFLRASALQIRTLREKLVVESKPPLLLLLRTGEPTLVYNGARPSARARQRSRVGHLGPWWRQDAGRRTRWPSGWRRMATSR